MSGAKQSGLHRAKGVATGPRADARGLGGQAQTCSTYASLPLRTSAPVPQVWQRHMKGDRQTIIINGLSPIMWLRVLDQDNRRDFEAQHKAARPIATRSASRLPPRPLADPAPTQAEGSGPSARPGGAQVRLYGPM